MSLLRYIFVISLCWQCLTAYAQSDGQAKLLLSPGIDLAGLTYMPLRAVIDEHSTTQQRVYGSIALIYKNAICIEGGIGIEQRAADPIYSSVYDFRHESDFGRFSFGLHHKLNEAPIGIKIMYGFQWNTITETGTIRLGGPYFPQSQDSFEHYTTRGNQFLTAGLSYDFSERLRLEWSVSAFNQAPSREGDAFIVEDVFDRSQYLPGFGRNRANYIYGNRGIATMLVLRYNLTLIGADRPELEDE